MKLKKFQRNNKRNTMLIIATVIVVGLVVSTNLIKSHAYFKTTKSFNIIQGKIPNKNNGDVTLAVKLDGEKYKEVGFPSKEGHKYVETKCNNDAEYSFDKNTWKITVTTNKPTVCTIYFETATILMGNYKENILNGTDPIFSKELIPVNIADNGIVTKANTDVEWYSYENSRWANAVILTGTDNYQVGDTIPEDNIQSYFVWIPKYRYKLKSINTNNTTPSEFDIDFNSDNTTNSSTECIAPNASGNNNSGSCDVGKWMTHPAFTSLGENINGIWVGKFETTGSTSVPTVKSNLSSIRNITGKVMYDTAWNFNRNLDSHMMKNTEWGAMVYLTNSKYGRGNSEVWINNYWNNETKTGCTGESVSAPAATTCTTPYLNNVAVKEGSTTRNMSGIFDTSGGAWDMVMGNLNNTTSSSGFPTNLGIVSKYYDKYTGTDSSARILGDATQETYGWNGDYTNFVASGNPWFYRGGGYYHTTHAGVFSFDNNKGGEHAAWSFRIVLSPTN